MKKVVIILIIVVIVVAIGIFSSVMGRGCAEAKRVRALPIAEINLSNISDGTYRGEYSYGGFTYEVEVVVKNHKIEDIKMLKNRKTYHAQKAEGVISKVLQAQSLNVDAVTGATTTSKTILKAIENAFTTKAQN
jgi:uncharacterized protein with FMN-binding domain